MDDIDAVLNHLYEFDDVIDLHAAFNHFVPADPVFNQEFSSTLLPNAIDYFHREARPGFKVPTPPVSPPIVVRGKEKLMVR